MKYISPIGIIACLFSGCISVAPAKETVPQPKPIQPVTQTYTLPPGVTEDMLAPPPVPRFMLEKPAKPLTTDEMLQQAREAEKTIKPAKPESVSK